MYEFYNLDNNTNFDIPTYLYKLSNLLFAIYKLDWDQVTP